MRAVKGLGPKFEENVLSALEQAAAQGDRGRARLLLPQALELGEALARGLEQGSSGAGATVMVAGSARRLTASRTSIWSQSLAGAPRWRVAWPSWPR